MKRIVLALLVLALLGTAAFAAAPAVRLQGTLKLDGVFDEAAWAGAAWQSNFLSASPAAEGAPKPVAVQTRFKVLFDDDALYVAVECDEPNLDKLAARYTEHDQDVYGDDCVELFMDPAGEGRYYQHFCINAKGAWYDDSGADYGLVHAKLWDCPLQVGTKVDKEGNKWAVEVRIPFAALTLRDDVKKDWLWNVTRERQAGGATDLSTWSPLKGNFHAPKLFGKLTGLNVDYKRFGFVIGEPQIIVAGDGSGNNRLDMKVKVTNQSPQARKVIVSAAPFGQTPKASAAPVDLAPGASAEVTLPQFSIRADVKTAAVQLTVADADSGAWYKVAVKRLNTEYKPIAVDVLQPVYRQNIYATQNVPELIFQVTLAPDIAEKAAQVVFSLHDEQGKSVREGKAKVAALAQPQKLEVGKLPVGAYTLKLRALDKGDGTIIDYATTVRKLGPATGSEVRVDGKRNLVVNGKPTLFIGWYGSVPEEDPRKDVVALQNIQTPVVLQGLDPKPIRDAWAKGIYSAVSIEPGRMLYTFNWWQKPETRKLGEEMSTLSAPSEEFLKYLRQLVDAVRNEPGVMGYYLADEPEINNARSDYMEAMYKAMQEIDPYHPLIVTNDTLDGIVTHGYRTCDILCPDPYSDAWDYVPNFLKRVLEVAPVGKGTMMDPWASSGQTHFTTVWGTAPPYPYKVMRNQYLVSIALGCRGWTGYTSAFFMPEPILRYGLPPIWREVKFLEPAVGNTNAEKPSVTADAEMASWLGEANGKPYLIVVNHKPGARTAKISHPLLAKVQSLYVVSEGRSVTVTGGAFSDKFAEGDAHVYTTDAAGQTLPTTAQVEQEIAAQEAATIKPGNLLHSSLGVRARSSDGYYAPWFTQFYYYAINGITDDIGWQLSHSDHGGWLELALPKEQKIGRVVVYTPNLQDFDLQFQSADGGSIVAEVRGNTQTVVTVNLPSQLPTLKLRITALATRAGTKPERAQVTEIEAYEQKTEGEVTPIKQGAAAAPPVNFAPPTAETGDKQVLWREDFTNFQTAPKYNYDGKDDKWVLNPADLLTEPKAGGGLVIASKSPVGYAGMTHMTSYDKDYRYFQVKISDIEQKGYRWAVVQFGNSSGQPGYRGGVHTTQPGIYTIDTYYVHDSYMKGEEKGGFIVVSAPGSQKQPDGTVALGAKYTFDWMQLVRRPVDGLAVTLADGSPLPVSLKEGDTLMFRLFLEKPAVDVTVETQVDSMYSPVAINGEPYVQLQKVGAKDGREWAAQVTLGKGTTKADGTKGYPVLFRAIITGGAIPNSLVNAQVKFE